MTETNHSFSMTVDKVCADDSVENILFTYREQLKELFQDCVFKHNIKIIYIEQNIYLIEYPKDDISFMYGYLFGNCKLDESVKCNDLDELFANPDDEWWEICGLRGNIISSYTDRKDK